MLCTNLAIGRLCCGAMVILLMSQLPNVLNRRNEHKTRRERSKGGGIGKRIEGKKC